jgi:hypothetical protein
MTRLIQCPHCKCSFPEDAQVGKEIPMKEWLSQQAEATGMTPSAVYMRLTRDKPKYYPNLQLRRVNQRVVFVRI